MKLIWPSFLALLTLSAVSCDRSSDKVSGVGKETPAADADATLEEGGATFIGRGPNEGQDSQVAFVADQGKVRYAVWTNFIPVASSGGGDGGSYNRKVVAPNGKEFVWKSQGAEELLIADKRLDLRKGRLVLLSDAGDVQQLDVDLTDAPVRKDDPKKPFWEALRKDNPKVSRFLGD